MEISKLMFFKKTREALADNPILTDPKKRDALRVQRVKEFVKEQPAGTHLRMGDLIAAAGYNYTDSNSSAYKMGWQFIKDNLLTPGILTKTKELDGKYTFTVNDAVTVTTPSVKKNIPSKISEQRRNAAKARWEKAKSKKPAQPKKAEQTKAPITITQVQDFQAPTPPILDLQLLQKEAQDFAWRWNSDSLRDFIADLNEQERIKSK